MERGVGECPREAAFGAGRVVEIDDPGPREDDEVHLAGAQRLFRLGLSEQPRAQLRVRRERTLQLRRDDRDRNRFRRPVAEGDSQRDGKKQGKSERPEHRSRLTKEQAQPGQRQLRHL